ncbi:MAG TPA: phospho-N-acetylmuramoyl-pentapeptide-transferase [Acidimicrobiales bacterium]
MIGLFIAAAVGMAVSLAGTPLLIRFQRARGIGQPIREEGPSSHLTKAGTPTMGGIAIVVGGGAGYAVAHLVKGAIFTWGGLLCELAIVGAGLVGLLDDWIKVNSARNRGLNKRAKIAGLLFVAVAFVALAHYAAKVHTELTFTRLDAFHLEIGPVLWGAWGVLLIVAATNAVNLTDGLDGLAAGSGIFSFAAYTVIGFWIFRHEGLYHVPQGLDLALVAASMLGACAGFLWWNAAPAQIFMGDTGALAIGAALASIALVSNTALLLPVIGGIYVVETVSVIVQVTAFRLFGRRVFRMAPIHHHFDLLGWPETTVIVRFWLLGGLVTAVGVGLFYADYLSVPGILK